VALAAVRGPVLILPTAALTGLASELHRPATSAILAAEVPGPRRVQAFGVHHTDQRPSYECSSRRDRLTTPSCRTVVAACVDDAVAGALLDALTSGQIALALSAADEVSGRRQRVSRVAELAVERARYEADRAERAFCRVEPENRLVARPLEARCERPGLPL
jgi:hypothetical protein